MFLQDYLYVTFTNTKQYIQSHSEKTLAQHRPVILFEANSKYAPYLHDNVCKHYPEYEKESKFDVVDYCTNTLGYRTCIERFNGSIDTLLLP